MQDFHTINYEPFIYGGTNITTVRLINPEDTYVQDVTKSWSQMIHGDTKMNKDYDWDYTEVSSSTFYVLAVS